MPRVSLSGAEPDLAAGPGLSWQGPARCPSPALGPAPALTVPGSGPSCPGWWQPSGRPRPSLLFLPLPTPAWTQPLDPEKACLGHKAWGGSPSKEGSKSGREGRAPWRSAHPRAAHPCEAQTCRLGCPALPRGGH